ncbi:uncharacterized protein OE_1183F [Halobacterium salinarum R1]|uniref:Uncharacterized protein n=2 Tax=Halobacterium salinarum NRC-34001 TaxID=2886895 RepID=A0A510N596_HALSA|nr:uncharacterized protein OE_1183F [Halobacterium salinarum R1]DAC77422.1 TPA_inf: uncharacterized protein VNG_0110a [Halobacterium salinarum NRC-1]
MLPIFLVARWEPINTDQRRPALKHSFQLLLVLLVLRRLSASLPLSRCSFDPGATEKQGRLLLPPDSQRPLK